MFLLPLIMTRHMTQGANGVEQSILAAGKNCRTYATGSTLTKRVLAPDWRVSLEKLYQN